MDFYGEMNKKFEIESLIRDLDGSSSKALNGIFRRKKEDWILSCLKKIYFINILQICKIKTSIHGIVLVRL